MNAEQYFPVAVFVLILVLAWMTLRRSSGYYGMPPEVLAAQASGTVYVPPPPPPTTTAPVSAPPPAPAAAPAPVAAPPPVASVADIMYTLKSQTDYPGSDIKYLKGSLDDCKAACSSDATCKGFVTSSDGKMCWLKNKIKGPRASMNRDAYGKPGMDLPEVVSTKNNSWMIDDDRLRWTYETATNYPGGDIASIPNQTDPSCARICEKTRGCAGVVRDISSPGMCTLKSSKGSSVFARDRNTYFLN